MHTNPGGNMSTPLLGVTANHNFFRVSYRGLHAWCTGWAGDPHGAVYVSLIGRTTAVTGIWAAFHERAPLDSGSHQAIFKRPALEGARYHTLRTRLPESDWLHLVILHSQATMFNLPDQTFFVLGRSPSPPLDAFWHQWNNALPLPARPEWTPLLWDQGESERFIIDLPSQGTFCWKVKATLRPWSQILQHIVEEERP